MSIAAVAPVPLEPVLGVFERWLTLWVTLCIVAGIALGQVVPAPFRALAGLSIARVNLPVGVLIWLMIVPMLVRIDFGALHRVTAHSRGL
jgi:ACR3 family arsenite transporter